MYKIKIYIYKEIQIFSNYEIWVSFGERVTPTENDIYVYIKN